jgi:SAM-dependent methyltransferase
VTASSPAPAYAALAPLYDQAVGHPFFGALRRAFDALVPRYGIRFMHALDLGCGTGLFACHLAQRYRASVLGIDNAPAMLAAARRNCRSCRVGFMQQDLRSLQLPWRFDLVTANFDTLNHLRDPAELRRALHTIAALLRPGGAPGVRLAHARRGALSGASARALAAAGAGSRVAASERNARCTRDRHPVRIERGWQPDAQHAERLYRAAEVGAWLREAGLVLRALLDAQSLEPAGVEPARARCSSLLNQRQVPAAFLNPSTSQ